MAYRQLTVRPILRIKIDEPGNRFSVWDTQKWTVPSVETDTFVNHKSVTQFLGESTEFTFRCRIGHQHNIIMARRDTGVGLAIFEVGSTGSVKIRHWPILQLATTALPPEFSEHNAIIIGLEGPIDCSMFVINRTDGSTAMIRYRSDNGGSIWLPRRYYTPKMAEATNPQPALTQSDPTEANQEANRDAIAGPSNSTSGDMQFRENRRRGSRRRARSQVVKTNQWISWRFKCASLACNVYS